MILLEAIMMGQKPLSLDLEAALSIPRAWDEDLHKARAQAIKIINEAKPRPNARHRR